MTLSYEILRFTSMDDLDNLHVVFYLVSKDMLWQNALGTDMLPLQIRDSILLVARINDIETSRRSYHRR
jgi:hypothetical protein